MKDAIVIGSGIAGMTCAVKLAEAGVKVMLVSPFPSERSQSVMAAGGINAVLADHEEGDSVACHTADTLAGGCNIAGERSVSGLCAHAEEIIRYLEGIGTVFSVDENGRPARRAFGGQSYRRTCYCGSATGKQIVSALVMETRKYEGAGMITRRLWSCFHSALIRDGVCYGVLLFDESTRKIEAAYADAVVIATGGQNALFGKTTGSTQCDGYTAGKLFLQGAELKNLEFIQYHPTAIHTGQKKMLISEAVRGEGGRLFYSENGKRVYFMEEKYGPRGNLMTRDVVSREIAAAGREVFLDISFLDRKQIEGRLPEVRDLCLKYRNLDITREPVPVEPSVHFFMGGLAVHLNHETNIRNLFAVGECASMYHGANRLGGNSLLAAVHSGMIAAEEIAARSPEHAVFAKQPAHAASAEHAVSARPAASEEQQVHDDFDRQLADANEELRRVLGAGAASPFPVMYIRDMLAETMNRNLGIVRDEASLDEGIADVDYYLSVADKITYDSSVMPYEIYSLKGILALAKAVLVCAKQRRESRGAHFRSDYPEAKDDFGSATIISYDQGEYRVRFDKERAYES